MKGWLKLTVICLGEKLKTHLSFCAFLFNAAAVGIGNSGDKMPIKTAWNISRQVVRMKVLQEEISIKFLKALLIKIIILLGIVSPTWLRQGFKVRWNEFWY